MPSTPWELYEAEAPDLVAIKRGLVYTFTIIIIVGTVVATFFGA